MLFVQTKLIFLFVSPLTKGPWNLLISGGFYVFDP